jgi:hypothetical protein
VFSADRLAHMFVHGLVRNCDRQQLQIALRRFAGTVPRRPAWYSLRQASESSPSAEALRIALRFLYIAPKSQSASYHISTHWKS